MLVHEGMGFDGLDQVPSGCIAIELPPSKLTASADSASFQAELVGRQRRLEEAMKPLLAAGWTLKEMGGKPYICPPG